MNRFLVSISTSLVVSKSRMSEGKRTRKDKRLARNFVLIGNVFARK